MSTQARRTISLVIAVVAAAIGGPLLWAGGGGLLRATQFQRLDAGSAGLAVLGIVLLLVSIATVALSNWGVIVVGVLHVLFGLVGVFVPSLPFRLSTLFSPVDGLVYGFPLFVGAGTALLFGLAYAMVGWAASARALDRPVVGWALGVPATLLGAVVAVFAGGRVYEGQAILLRPDVAASVALLFGLVIFAGGVFAATRWSVWGLLVPGAVLALAGIVFAVDPYLSRKAFHGWGQGLDLVGPTLYLLALGLLLVAAAVALRVKSGTELRRGMLTHP